MIEVMKEDTRSLDNGSRRVSIDRNNVEVCLRYPIL